MHSIHSFLTSGNFNAIQNDQNEHPEIVLRKTTEGHASRKRSNTGFDESILGESMHPDVCYRNGAQGNKGKRNALHPCSTSFSQFLRSYGFWESVRLRWSSTAAVESSFTRPSGGQMKIYLPTGGMGRAPQAEKAFGLGRAAQNTQTDAVLYAEQAFPHTSWLSFRVPSNYFSTVR